MTIDDCEAVTTCDDPLDCLGQRSLTFATCEFRSFAVQPVTAPESNRGYSLQRADPRVVQRTAFKYSRGMEP